MLFNTNTLKPEMVDYSILVKAVDKIHRKYKKGGVIISRSKGNKSKERKDFPNVFPFWARLKINKNRTTLVIDEKKVLDKKIKKVAIGTYVHTLKKGQSNFIFA